MATRRRSKKPPVRGAGAQGARGNLRLDQNAGTSDPLNCVSMKLLTSGDW
jgi:hypothetical protein